MKHIKLFEQFISEKEEYKVAGRPVTLNKGKKENGTDWTVTFLSDSSIGRKGEEVPLSDVLALIKPFPKGIKESTIEEGTYNSNREIAVYDGEDGLTYIEKRGSGYYGYNDEFDFTADSKAELEKKLKSWKYRLISGSIDESILNEYDTRNFKPASPDSKSLKGAEKWLKKYMSRTAKTTKEATKRIESFAGGVMFTYVQYHIVKPNGNKPDRPTFRLHQSQEWLNDANLQGREEVNATFLSIYQLKEGEEWNTSQGDAWEKIGQIYVDTKAFLNELGIVFETIKRA